MYGSVKKYTFTILIAAFLVAGGIVAFLSRPGPSASKMPDTPAVTYSAPPSSEPIAKESYQQTAVGDEPALLKLPSIGAEGFIQKVGIDQNGEVAVPNNVHLAGWFSKSAKPGQPGLSVIDGHVNGVSTQAIFARLHELQPGSQFEVTLANASQLRYEVAESKTVLAKEAATYLFSQHPSIGSQLNLITCAGAYDQKADNYDKRLIVSARLLD